MEEIEVSTETQMEEIHHHAEHSGERWLLYCALISAFLAVGGAITGLYAAHYANEAMLEQMHASDHWGYYQAKGIKAAIIESRLEGTATPALQDKLDRYKKEQEEIKTEATQEETASRYFMHQHEVLARAITAFQVSIAITAISAITRRKHFLILTFILATLGCIFSAQAFFG